VQKLENQQHTHSSKTQKNKHQTMDYGNLWNLTFSD